MRGIFNSALGGLDIGVWGSGEATDGCGQRGDNRLVAREQEQAETTAQRHGVRLLDEEQPAEIDQA